ncbi:WD40 repeat-like protein [Rozella allomycis CSF55]|uniref:WD40 repeat-like protein n=1 Tax=Rozella allomycis (strain CSF55) TaxID=988480 RepID=A0A4P9YN10_ROZAC|nr:WD40 repeat-like protein [Rozella allomycis CSF55]
MTNVIEWNPVTRESRILFDTQQSQMSSMMRICSLTSKGKYIVIGGYQGEILVWDNSNLKVYSLSSEPAAIFTHFQFSNLRVSNTLYGHSDFCFAIDWSPCGKFVATGSQDCTARMANKCINVMKGNISGFRNIKFSPDGKYIAMCETADYVHLYDTNDKFSNGQIIDFFEPGEITGFDWSRNSDSFFIGCYDSDYGGIIEFQKSRNGIPII